MSEPTFDPAAPNQDKTIHIRFTTDENGDMTVAFSSEGFGDHPEAVAAYLAAAVRVATLAP